MSHKGVNKNNDIIWSHYSWYILGKKHTTLPPQSITHTHIYTHTQTLSVSVNTDEDFLSHWSVRCWCFIICLTWKKPTQTPALSIPPFLSQIPTYNCFVWFAIKKTNKQTKQCFTTLSWTISICCTSLILMCRTCLVSVWQTLTTEKKPEACTVKQHF